MINRGRIRLKPGFASPPRIISTWLIGLSCLALLPASALAQVACKPLLSVKSVQETRNYTPTHAWRWQATVVADANHCATRSGNFEFDFVRLKENSPDLQFTEKFRWAEGQFVVSMELTSDEAVSDFRIGFIAPCVCRAIDQLSVDYRPE